MPTNATVAGRVTDPATGDGVPNARVRLRDQAIPYETTTDHEGRYELEIYTHVSAEHDVVREVGLTVEADGFETYRDAVRPEHAGETAVEVELVAPTEQASYEVATHHQLPLNAYRGAASDDLDLIAIVPFHTSASVEEKRDSSFVHAFDGRGEERWRFPLTTEALAVDVARDGSRVATAIPYSRGPFAPTPTIDPGVYLLDADGERVWTVPSAAIPDSEEVREVRISPDAKFVAAGDYSGHCHLFDSADGTRVWSRFIGGQVRYVLFEPDGSVVYVAGDPFLLAFRTETGEQLWETDVGSWAHGLALADDYLFASGKAGRFVALVRTDDGGIEWTYPVYARADRVSVTPDASTLLYQSTIPSIGTGAFDADGKLQWIRPGSTAGTVTDDGRYFALLEPRFGEGITVQVLNRRGHSLWSHDRESHVRDVVGEGFARTNDDASRIILAAGEDLFFLEGGIERATPTQDAETSADGMEHDGSGGDEQAWKEADRPSETSGPPPQALPGFGAVEALTGVSAGIAAARALASQVVERKE